MELHFNAKNYLQPLLDALHAERSADNAYHMKRYMKNQFEFYGIKSPERRAIQATFLKGQPKLGEKEMTAMVKEAFQVDEREVQYFACEQVDKAVKRYSVTFIDTLKWMMLTKSWWDTVDSVSKTVGRMVLQYPQLTKVMDKWIEGDKMWLQRAAIIHQLRFKKETDSDRLFGYCAYHAHSTEFFIRKGIGWALREYSKVNPKAVIEFIDTHPDLSGLSRREGLKWVKNKGLLS